MLVPSLLRAILLYLGISNNNDQQSLMGNQVSLIEFSVFFFFDMSKKSCSDLLGCSIHYDLCLFYLLILVVQKNIFIISYVTVVKMFNSSRLRTTNKGSCRAWNCGCAVGNPYPCRWPSSSWTRFPATRCATFTEARKSWRTCLITPSSRSAIYVSAIKYPSVR